MTGKSETEKLAGTANGCIRALAIIVIGGVGLFVLMIAIGSCLG